MAFHHQVLAYCATVLLISRSITAEIKVVQRNGTEVIKFHDLMASFGPSVEDEGITGFVHPVYPIHACKEVDPPPHNSTTWIAIIARSNCTFVEKVAHVQAAGFNAAIVYNFENNDNRIQMGGDGSGIDIPSVFVGWTDGLMLATDYCYFCRKFESEDGSYLVTISDEPNRLSPYPLWPFVVVVGTCFVLMLIFMMVKWCRDFRKKRKSRLSTKHLKKIPTKKFKKGEEYDVCAICLDDYEEGDKLRLLPCSHVYHCKCIDPWLTKNKRCCPVCKRKVIPGDDPSSDSDSDEESAPTSSERTPLLSGNNNRRSTFDNSGLPEALRTQTNTVGQSPGNDTDTSSDSEAELGAVGGAPSPGKHSHTTEQSVVIETSQGEENGAYHSEDDVEVISEEEYEDFSDLAFANGQGRKEDAKQLNHVV